MTFGSHFSGIWVVQLDSENTGKVKSGSKPVKLAIGQKSPEQKEKGIEFTKIEA